MIGGQNCMFFMVSLVLLIHDLVHVFRKLSWSVMGLQFDYQKTLL
jgi:hypothetical protein